MSSEARRLRDEKNSLVMFLNNNPPGPETEKTMERIKKLDEQIREAESGEEKDTQSLGEAAPEGKEPATLQLHEAIAENTKRMQMTQDEEEKKALKFENESLETALKDKEAGKPIPTLDKIRGPRYEDYQEPSKAPRPSDRSQMKPIPGKGIPDDMRPDSPEMIPLGNKTQEEVESEDAAGNLPLLESNASAAFDKWAATGSEEDLAAYREALGELRGVNPDRAQDLDRNAIASHLHKSYQGKMSQLEGALAAMGQQMQEAGTKGFEEGVESFEEHQAVLQKLIGDGKIDPQLASQFEERMGKIETDLKEAQKAKVEDRKKVQMMEFFAKLAQTLAGMFILAKVNMDGGDPGKIEYKKLDFSKSYDQVNKDYDDALALILEDKKQLRHDETLAKKDVKEQQQQIMRNYRDWMGYKSDLRKHSLDKQRIANAKASKSLTDRKNLFKDAKNDDERKIRDVEKKIGALTSVRDMYDGEDWDSLPEKKKNKITTALRMGKVEHEGAEARQEAETYKEGRSLGQFFIDLWKGNPKTVGKNIQKSIDDLIVERNRLQTLQKHYQQGILDPNGQKANDLLDAIYEDAR